MTMKVAQKTNVNGWRKQVIIDHENKTITTGTFLYHCADVENLTATQLKQIINFYISNGYEHING